MPVNYFIDAESPILSYSGSGWRPVLSTDIDYAPHYNNGTGMYTNTTGDSLEINFFGTGISLYGSKLSDHGQFNATLDGTTTTASTYSADAKWATRFYNSPNLNRGLHTLVITDAPKLQNRTFLSVDYLTVQDSAPPFPAKQPSLFVDDTDESIFTYLPSRSSWESMPDTLSLGGTLSRTQSQIGAVEIRFVGSSIALYGRVGQSNAQYWCSIDGGVNISYNSFANEMASQQTLYMANNLTGGGAEHVLRVWNDPTVSNGHVWLEIDYAQVWGNTG
ncbi:hypothetical protein DL93DRAFT_812981 [Clavulina sp. PMI_390]|nr:hypothetical protein DL93DRAFT_812981 [Clavulina sp. PMI_390]